MIKKQNEFLLQIKKLVKEESGQGIVEYSLVTGGIIAALAISGVFVIPYFMDALQIYLDGFYFILSLPIP